MVETNKHVPPWKPINRDGQSDFYNNNSPLPTTTTTATTTKNECQQQQQHALGFPALGVGATTCSDAGATGRRQKGCTRSGSERSCYKRNKLIELRWIGRGLRSETMLWARQNQDVGESEKSCLKTQDLGLGFNF